MGPSLTCPAAAGALPELRLAAHGPLFSTLSLSLVLPGLCQLSLGSCRQILGAVTQ